MNNDKLHNEDKWDSGELGRSLEHAEAAPPGASASLDDALGMQLISIRLPRALIADLKNIAEHHGIAYQPMVRDLLTRFSKSELKSIYQERLNELEQRAEKVEESEPVSDFLKRKQA